MKPSPARLVVVTQVSTAAITGAEHGAATNPETVPMMNAPEKRPTAPAELARWRIEAGTLSGRTSSSISAETTSRFAIAK
jgi:hypothetical protein